MNWEETVMGEREIDNLTPTMKELEKYLAEPDDAVAASLDAETRRRVGRIILYTNKVAKAQAEKTWDIAHAKGKAEGRRELIVYLLREQCRIYKVARYKCSKCVEDLLKELE